ncbi:MAG: RHS repeat-associated core domain-containing protein [Gemmatimonadota bacterium]
MDLLPQEEALVPVRWEASTSAPTDTVSLTASYSTWTNTGIKTLTYYPWVAPSVTAQGIPPGGFNEGGVGLIQSFTVTNNGSSRATYSYTVSCVDDVGEAAIPASCAVVTPAPDTVAAGASVTVQVRFNAGDAGTSSTMTLVATEGTDSTSGPATIAITQLPASITTTTPSVVEFNGASETHSFMIHNPNAVAENYSWNIACYNAASCTPSSGSIGVGAKGDTSLSASYTTSGAPNATGSVVATVSNLAGTATDSILVRIKSYMVQIATVGSADTVASGVLDTATFTVKNIGLDSMSYSVSASCDGTAATACQQPSTPISLLPSQQKTVTVRFTGGGTDYSSGAVTLHVVANDGGTYADSAAVAVSVHSPNAVHVSTAFMNNDDQDMSLCAASCFAMTASRSTVPYYTLNTPRSVTLAYNGDRAFPRPFIYADVSVPSAPANIQNYTLEVKRLGAHLLFTNGDSVLTFAGTSSPATTYRLAGQLDMSSYGTGIDSVTLVVTAHYANGMSDVTPVKTQLMIVNSTLNTQSSPIAKGWTIAGLQHFWPTPEGSGSPSGGYMIENGDGSATYFASNGAMAADFSTLHFDSVATWIRTYQDSSKVLFDGGGRMLAAIDRLGRKTTFNYGGLDSLQVTSIIEPMRSSGSSASAPYLVLSYDANHHLQSITETGGTGGRTTSVTVDPTTGHLTRVTDPDGGYDSYGYDGSGRLSTITDRRGNTTTYDYDLTWKLSRIVSPLVPIDAGGGSTTTGTPTTNIAAWQAVGVPTVATASNPAPLLDADTIAARVTDPKGYVSTIYPDRWGEPLKTVDALGNVTTITRQGFLPTVVTYPDGSADSATYNLSNGLLLTQRAAGQQMASYIYGARSQLQGVSGSGVVSVSNTLDSLGRVLRTHYGTVAGDTTEFTYDPVTKNVATMFRADTGLVTYQYDSNFGNLSTETDPGNRMTQSYFDSYGRDTSTKAPQFPRTRVVYDSLNRVTASYDSVGANPVMIKYDAILPVSVRDQLSHIDSTEYDALGRITRHFGYASSTLATTARYDLDSRPTSTTNRRGQRIDLKYDPLGRVLSKTGGNNETSTDNSTYSANGLVQTAANATDSVRTVSVPLALLDTVQTTIWAPGVTRHTYTVVHYHSADAGGTDSTTISSDGAPAQFVTRRYVRDSTSGTLKSIDLGLNIGHGNFIYDAPGRRVSTAWPTGGSGSGLYLSTGSHVTQNYNPGISGYLSAAYRVDSAGRIRADSRTQTGTDTVVTNRIFAYDALGRYAGATDASAYSWACSQNRDRYDVNYGMVNCPIDSVAAPQLYSYDAAGNRADPGDTLGVGDQMRAVTFSGMHQDYTYDADGNVITRALPVDNATWVYTWSSDNRLLSGSNWIGMENLAYDALGQPVVIRKGSDNHIARVTLYDGGNVLADLDSLGNREGEYVYDAGTDHPYALLTGATAVTGVQYFVLDDFGNVTGTVYDSTHVAQTISYDDWGDATVTGDQTNRLAWKGLPIDSHLWLSEVRARWYDPVQGRFISEDPLGLSAGINPYVFANNDPINGHDPSGALATDQDGSVCSINAESCGNALEFPGSLSGGAATQGFGNLSANGGGGVSYAGGVSFSAGDWTTLGNWASQPSAVDEVAAVTSDANYYGKPNWVAPGIVERSSFRLNYTDQDGKLHFFNLEDAVLQRDGGGKKTSSGIKATYDVLTWAYDGSTDPNDHLIWARRIPVLSSLIRVGTGRKGFAGGFVQIGTAWGSFWSSIQP